MEEKFELIDIELDIDVCNKIEEMAKINNISLEEMTSILATEGIIQDKIKNNIDKINTYMSETTNEMNKLEELRKRYITSIESTKENEKQ